MAERLLAEGEDARVYVDGNRVRKELREGGLRGMPVKNPLSAFYAHKIAEVLFPGRVVQYDFAKRRVRKQGERSPAVLRSDLIETTDFHRQFVEWFYRKKRELFHFDFATEIVFAPDDVKRHFDRVADSHEVQKAVDRMWERGVVVSDHPVNIDFVRGKPFFFEVEEIDGKLIRQTIMEHPKGEQIRRYYERYKEAARKGSVYRGRERKARW